jgi:hypothetical protein
MILARFTKQPNEVRKYIIDYSERLGTETLVSITEVTFDPITSPSLGVAAALNFDATRVIAYISGGVDSEEYKVDIRVATTDGAVVWEDELLVSVEEV